MCAICFNLEALVDVKCGQGRMHIKSSVSLAIIFKIASFKMSLFFFVVTKQLRLEAPSLYNKVKLLY